MEDLELLREYVEHRSEQAFTELVHRHIDLVYSTALRLVPESQLADDVTQLVFLKLARKAASLRQGTILTGWLYRTTQFVAQTAVRSDSRRRQRESLAMQFRELNDDRESVWKGVAPLLEQAVAQLRQADQDAVLLRFFAGKNLREVGQALGISDDAAQKRVTRALEAMRDYFAARGVTFSVAAVTTAIAAHAVQAAPAGLASNLAAASLGGLAGKAGFVATLNAFPAIVLAKLKSAAGGWLVAALATLVSIMFVLRLVVDVGSSAAVATTSPPTAVALILRGTVRSPDGKPYPGALVRVATPQINVRLYQTTNAPPSTNNLIPMNVTGVVSNLSARPPRQAPSTNTAADGSFVIALTDPPKDGLAAVLVNSDEGYALVTAAELAANPEVTVQPWASIEGVLRVGKSVASNATVNIGIWGSTELYDWNLVHHGASTKTDANGRFVFSRIAPVEVWLTRTVMVRTNDGRQSGHRYVKVLPGDRILVQLGGAGRALTGRVQWDSTNKLVFYGSMWADAAPGIRHPRDWKSMSREAQRNYDRAWRDLPESDLWKESVRNYEFPVLPGGTFRVDDVLPGTYRMQVRADEPKPDGTGKRHAAVVEIRVEVPDILPDETEEPIDLGTLVPRPVLYR